ncbi:MAG: Fe-S cluster assembly protein SufB [Candidatus Wildermuthbacteria bacterium RIFCSPHIGHO2_01_FULL_47_27]|uniref:Fe-S cluster assembly protein SufB n=2 Tax=Candidatus Wildermuthiibacteriota TaxID=1817923 RepID=A0A1G2RLS4_9BACT|nr:MAG: Fe-S cluster assembly protein SufB [Candidatus Wildermuthbacteria bacterium RIFCSPHIGHO2_01_FULL_47_27]OHA68393.1 MAG: Fe-S cluster assembly protein SufB [Candidatus Wildermuthbacteria bacterium RIFCSPHIGHO2_02_FULL_47_17]OHA73815.1 MAG: Fe-S cluster assembly protein SufB [Candidatus Wildermuthbacteria bacterium RIFCSPLOWO2_01_FULL_48_35]
MVIKSSNKYGFAMPDISVYKTPRGLSPKVVREISRQKNEPTWMLELRLRAYGAFKKMPMPVWGPDISGINFDEICYYAKPILGKKKSWSEVPKNIRKTFDRLGIPEAEKKMLAGVGAQYDSEVIYQSLRKELSGRGVIFTNTDSALKEYPDIFKEYFGQAVPFNDNKFAALNSAVWSGGSFIYVPPGVSVEIPLQAYFRINAKGMGQFERTLIVADKGSEVHYIEACSAPLYSEVSLHAAVVEIFLKKGARVRYTTIQNWSDNVYNLVTKRAMVDEAGEMRWIDGNIGSKVTMKYPSCVLRGKKAKGEMLSFAYAGKGQTQDTGGKMIHLAPHTVSRIISKSISRQGGISTFRALSRIAKGAKGSKTHMRCDALLLDKKSKADTFPSLKIDEQDASASHEAVVGRVGSEQLFYLRSRGFSEKEAVAMIVTGFLEPIVKEIPLEYAIELNRLMGMEIRGL